MLLNKTINYIIDLTMIKNKGTIMFHYDISTRTIHMEGKQSNFK